MELTGYKFLLVETKESKSLDFQGHYRLTHFIGLYDFLLWKNEGEYVIIDKGQIKETLRVHEELSRVPKGQLSTASCPMIHWDDCEPVGPMRAEVMLGKEHDFYRDADKPQDGSHS